MAPAWTTAPPLNTNNNKSSSPMWQRMLYDSKNISAGVLFGITPVGQRPIRSKWCYKLIASDKYSI